VDDLPALSLFKQGKITDVGKLRAGLISDIGRIASDFGKEFYKVPDPTWFERAANTLKSGMSIGLLGFSPGYVVRNFGSNEVLTFTAGIHAWSTPAQQRAYFSKMMGITDPAALDKALRDLQIFRGVGAAGITEGITAKMPGIRLGGKIEELKGGAIVANQWALLNKDNWPRILGEVLDTDEWRAVRGTLEAASPGAGDAVERAFRQATSLGEVKELATKVLGGQPIVAQFTDTSRLHPMVVAQLQEAIEAGGGPAFESIVQEGLEHTRQVTNAADEVLHQGGKVVNDLSRAKAQGVDIADETIDAFNASVQSRREAERGAKRGFFGAVRQQPEYGSTVIGRLEEATWRLDDRTFAAADALRTRTWAQDAAIRAGPQPWDIKRSRLNDLWTAYRAEQEMRFATRHRNAMRLIETAQGMVGRGRQAGPGAMPRGARQLPLMPEVADMSRIETRKVAQGVDEIARGMAEAVPPVSGVSDSAVSQVFGFIDSQITPAMRDMQDATLRLALTAREQTLLNYSYRTNFDWWTNFIWPYEFWYTHTGVNILRHFIDRPAMLASYYRLKRAIDNQQQEPGFPARMRGKVKFSLANLPDWMGGELFVDPLRSVSPIESFIDPYLPEEEETTAAGRAMRAMGGVVSVAPWITLPLAATGALGPKEQWASGAFFPPARALRGITGLMGRPVDITPIRSMMGLRPGETWDVYRAERMVSNMAGTKEITVEQAQNAMSSHRGDVWEEAVRRAAQERGVRQVGQAVGISGLDVYPAGERAQRALQQERNRIVDEAAPEYREVPYEEKAAWREAHPEADKRLRAAWKSFYADHPEYSAREFLFADPRQRLIDVIENEYYGRGAASRRTLRKELGGDFVKYFIAPDTQDITKFTTVQLAEMAQKMGREVGAPVLAETQREAWLRPVVEPTDPEIAYLRARVAPEEIGEVPAHIEKAYKEFTEYRDENFPESIYQIQSGYFAFPKGSQQRRNYLVEHPILKTYWDWARAFKANHPEFAEWYAATSGAAPTAALPIPSAGVGVSLPIPMAEARRRWQRQWRPAGGRAPARVQPRAVAGADWTAFIGGIADGQLRAQIEGYLAQAKGQRAAFARRYKKLTEWLATISGERLEELARMFWTWRLTQEREEPTARRGRAPLVRWYTRRW